MTFHTESDEKANTIINGMALGTVWIAAMPPVVDVTVYAAAVGASVILIADCYGIKVSKEEASNLVMEFLKYAGWAFAGGKLISGFLKATGLAYAWGGAIDAALYGTMSFAIGKTAQTYFKGERDPEKLKKILNDAYHNSPGK